MKKIYILFLVLIACKLISCKKDVIEDLDINYTLLDDVSPVIVKFKVNKDIYYAQWIINDSIELSFGEKNEMEYIFTKPGISKVEFNGINHHGEKLAGKINLNIPDIANKLKIKGIYIKDAFKYDFKHDSVELKFGYYDSNQYHYYKVQIPTVEFKIKDTIIFKNPIDIDIDNLYDKKVMSDKFIYVEIIYFIGNHINYLFRSIAYLKTEYFIERNIDSFFYSDDMHLCGFYENDIIKDMTLIADYSR